MNIIKTSLSELYIIEPDIFGDKRGFFLETYNKKRYTDLGISAHFVQDNISSSQKGTLRGLHFQTGKYAQGKLVQVLSGSVFDVAVDIRKDSETYGHYESVILSAENKKQFWIPEGFAHGFLVLEDNTLFSYKCTNYYTPKHESGIIWNDKDLNIKWNVQDPIISEKDLNLRLFSEI